ncbi:MAG: MscL family protein [Candidatus Micrarchaeota archaeon]|nr:MscL family protein [Candidatus Micrarchaeota archaeon]
MGFVEEFFAFLSKHKVIGLAVAFIIGVAASKLVTSLVNDIIMPVVSLLLPGGDWRAFAIRIGGTADAPKSLLIGDFAGSLIDFAIIALVIFLIVKFIVKEEEEKK